MFGKVIEGLKHPNLFFGFILHRLACFIKDDETYLKWYYFFPMKRWPDLKNPKSFNEKLQWLKIHDKNPAYTKMVDKYEVKKYIGELLGQEYVIPTLGVWDKFEDINFDSLPRRFVLKCTHDSGGLVICKDKSSLNVDSARKKINKCLKKDYYIETREFPYKNVKPRIIAEEYIEQPSASSLNDYKVLCFSGKAKLIEYHVDRFTDKHTQDFYDAEWNKTPITQGGYSAFSDYCAPKPVCFDEMIRFSELITKDMAHCRVDWYEINGKLFFGEITFFDGSGVEAFDNYADDLILGSWIDLKKAYSNTILS